MKKIKIFFFLIFSLAAFIIPSFAFDDILLDVDFKKGFKKVFKPDLKPIERVRMVETKQEWLEESKDIPVEQRTIREDDPPKSDDKQYIPEPKYIFEKYNFPHGSRTVNVDDVKTKLISNPIIVSDARCYNVAYVQYYYSPDINQISSNFYVGKLDTTKTKTERILAYRHNQEQRSPIIEAGTKEFYPNYFRGLSVIDWGRDSNKVLIKEQAGSTLRGIYKTYIYVYYMDKNKVVKLDNFDETVKKYYKGAKRIDLTKYTYELVPLGFAAENDDMIIIHCYLYNKYGKRIFMGTWSYNLFDDEILLLSSTNPSYFMSSNGLVLRRVLK